MNYENATEQLQQQSNIILYKIKITIVNYLLQFSRMYFIPESTYAGKNPLNLILKRY